MATLGRDDSPSPRRRRKGFAKKLEYCCCSVFTYFPLFFVYGLTSWACYVGVAVGLEPGEHWANGSTSLLVVVLYLLANTSYSIAVFTSPGSPTDSPSSGYSSLPTTSSAPQQASVLTTKSDGHPRYCKKCSTPKPDRAHHCSTCRRCVLKMDHHCPWLATCVGLRNYKAFLLFLIYTSLFCWACFAVSAQWVWSELGNPATLQNGSMTVNVILLAVLAGIIGLVLSGFAGWHVYLATRGMTTIECLEKTRYLTGVKRGMETVINDRREQAKERDLEGGDGEEGEALLEQGQRWVAQLKEIHANALPGVTRPEEGEERDSNTSTPLNGVGRWGARDSLRRNWSELEEQRERDRYANYLDEKDSEKLPHAFDLGWRRNLSHLFGKEWWLWWLPVCNTTGDGWRWEVSDDWVRRRDELARQREQGLALAESNWRDGAANGFGMGGARTMGSGRHYAAPQALPHQQREQQQQRQRDDGDEYDTSSDEERSRPGRRGEEASRNWNDVPEEYARRPESSGRPKGD